jgi:predicted HAD superfamily Cof-like phosphohydrolase
MTKPEIVIKPILSHTKDWFEKAVPNPNTKNFTTQLGVHFEEVAEMITEITPENDEVGSALLDALTSVKHLGELLKRAGGAYVQEAHHKDFLDSICDQIVTATGVAHMSNFDILGAMNEVNRSNFSKFGDNGEPIFDANMKVTKGPNYEKANLNEFI